MKKISFNSGSNKESNSVQVTQYLTHTLAYLLTPSLLRPSIVVIRERKILFPHYIQLIIQILILKQFKMSSMPYVTRMVRPMTVSACTRVYHWGYHDILVGVIKLNRKVLRKHYIILNNVYYI